MDLQGGQNDDDIVWQNSQKLELRFQTKSPFFAKKADEIDELFIKNWEQTLRDILARQFEISMDELDCKDIIDVGCGSRSDVNVVPGSGRRVGIDPLIADFQKYKVSYQRNNVELYTQKAEKLHFREDSFDVAFCFNVLDHVQNVRMVLSEIYRVLKPKGRLLLSVHTYEFLSNKIPSRIIKLVDPTHPQHLSHKQVIQQTRLPGFEINRYALYPLKLHYGNFLLRMAVYLFGRTLWLVASKQTI